MELNLDFLSTQQEGAAADIGDTSFQAADRQSAEVYAKEYEPLRPPLFLLRFFGDGLKIGS